MNKPLVFDQPKVGHFCRGARVIARLLEGEALIGWANASWRALVAYPGPVVCQTADDYILIFLLVAFLRSFRRRITVAITVRDPARTAATAMRRFVRRRLERISRSLPHVTILSNVPITADSISPFQIFDTEWWDLSVSALAITGEKPAVPEPISVVFLGNVGWHKGSGFFVDVAEAAARRGENMVFSIVGDVRRLSNGDQLRFHASGGRIYPAPGSDADFVSWLNRADWVWCCYHPDSNKSSGIFGRTMQLAKPAIVRAGSYIAPFQRLYGRGIAVVYGDINAVLDGLRRVPSMPAVNGTEFFRSYTRKRLLQACGVPDV